MSNALPAIDQDVANLANGLDLADSDDRAIFRQRVAHLYRLADQRRIDPRVIADTAIRILAA